MLTCHEPQCKVLLPICHQGHISEDLLTDDYWTQVCREHHDADIGLNEPVQELWIYQSQVTPAVTGLQPRQARHCKSC